MNRLRVLSAVGAILVFILTSVEAPAELLPAVKTPAELLPTVVLVDPSIIPCEPRHRELGDIGSDGKSGRQLHVRPLPGSKVGDVGWAFFPPHLQLPDIFPEPTPPSPDQDSIFLTEGVPLAVVIPQLQHMPVLGTVDVDSSLVGNTLTIDASLHTGFGVTATIYGPHEFLLAIGELPAGQYHLDFNLTRTADFFDGAFTSSGYMNFCVHPVPEPSTIGWLLVGLGLLSSCRRGGNRRDCQARGA